jgi:polysaccharide deacetylase family sporulation protein PdaB
MKDRELEERTPMKRSKYVLTTLFLLALTAAGCATHEQHATPSTIDKRTPVLQGEAESTVRASQPASATTVVNKIKQLHYSGSVQGKQVALTFDDGPDNYYTLQILDILKKENVKATFFIVGERAKAHPDVVKRIVNDGHAIGNHSWDHPDFPKINSEQATKEVTKTQEELESIVGFRPSLFRPPYGSLNDSDIQTITGMGLNIIDWSVDTRDWAGTPTPKIMEYVRKELKPGGIILEHCAGGRNENLSNTVSALEQIIPLLKKEGYNFVTVPTLLSLPTSIQ